MPACKATIIRTMLKGSSGWLDANLDLLTNNNKDLRGIWQHKQNAIITKY